MSRIHQAMQRARKEGWTPDGIPSEVPDRPSEVVARRGPSTLATHVPELPKKDLQGVEAAQRDFTSLIETKTVPDSRLVALSNTTFDGLRDKLCGAKADLRASGSDLKTILITSVGVGDGKSLISANVSISISKASLGQRVLLVDANLKSPSLHRLLGIPRENGLADLLGTTAAQQVISRTNISNFYVVTAGSMVENPCELVNTRKMSDFLALAKKHFDWVFLDSPSLRLEPDADLMSAMVDAVVLVTRSSQSCAGPLRESISTLHGRNVLGVVLNNVDAHNASFSHR